MQLIRVNRDVDTLTTALFQQFKDHLRILHNEEDDMIRLYLQGAIEAIEIFSGNDIFPTEYKVFYPNSLDLKYPSNFEGWYCGKWNVHDFSILDAGIDVTADYTVDEEHGMVYPHPMNHEIMFIVGFDNTHKITANLTTIIYRYAADLFENREAVRVGEPKMLPTWVQYVLPSVWKPRV